MAYGFATHLWLLGAPVPAQVTDWLVAAAPDIHQGNVEVWRLGDRVLISALNTSDRESRWRSIDLVNSLPALAKGFEWVSIDIQPDHGFWRVQKSTNEALEWDPDQAEEEHPEAPAALVERAKQLVRSLVPLKLDELHHYVDWAQELEATQEGATENVLNVPIQRLSLGLPPAPLPPIAVAVTQGVWSGLYKFWLEIACVVATALTVSMVQGPGPGRFSVRLNHFLIQAGALWLFGVVLMGVTSNGWPHFREFLWAVTVFAVSGLLWSALPV